MRPVNRGEWPRDADGNKIPFANYSDARDDLIRRIGDYYLLKPRPLAV